MVIFDQTSATLLPVGQDGVPRAGIDDRLAQPRAARRRQLAAATTTAPWLLRGGYGIFYDSGTLIENSALYFNPPYFTSAGLRARRAGPPTAADPFPSAGGLRAAGLGEHAGAGVSHRVRAAGQPRARGARRRRRRCRRAGWARAGRRPGAQAQSESAAARRQARSTSGGRFPATATSCWSKPAARRVYNALQLRAERPRRARAVAARRLDLGQIDRRQSAFLASEGNDNTPQNSARPDLERGLSDFDVRHRAVAAAIWQVPAMGEHGAGARLAGERAADGAERAALHAARQQRQQQHREPGRAVRLRPARTRLPPGTPGRGRATAAARSRSRRPSPSATPAATS